MAGVCSRKFRWAAIACGVIVCVLAGYLVLGGAVYYWKEYIPHHESGALASLMALHTMQENYKNDRGSYASTFAQMGVPMGARLEEGELLSWNGPYRYRISRITRNQTGIALEYSIEARPTKYARGARRSYLMDQTGTIHFTSMNRAAVYGDPSVPVEK